MKLQSKRLINVRCYTPFVKQTFIALAAMIIGASGAYADDANAQNTDSQTRKAATSAKQIDESRKVVVDDGTERDFWLYVPAKVKDGTYKNVPVVFALHGGSEDYQPTHSGNLNFNSLASQNLFIVVYPRGKERMFPHFNPNAARAWLATGAENEDTRYFESIIDTLNNNVDGFTIDNDRIYMAGFSVGGMMTYATSNVLADKFAAFASISGFPMNEVHMRHTSKPVPFMHVHGTKDSFVRYDLTPTIIDNMLNRNGLSYTPDSKTKGSATVWGDGSTTYQRSIYGKNTTTPYIFYQIGTGSTSSDKGMGHNNWCSIGGKDVQQVMWEFLKQYRLTDERNADIEFKADVNTAINDLTYHGWKVNIGEKTLVKYGESGGYTSTNQNVYHSIQLNAGTHYLKFTTANGEPGQFVTVKLTKLGKLSNFDELMGKTTTSSYFKVTNTAIINNEAYLADNQQTVVEFTLDEPSELMLLIMKGNKSDATTLSDIEIAKTGTPTPTNITGVIADQSNDISTDVYDLTGKIVSRHGKANLPPGVYVADGKKFIVK